LPLMALGCYAGSLPIVTVALAGIFFLFCIDSKAIEDGLTFYGAIIYGLFCLAYLTVIFAVVFCVLLALISRHPSLLAASVIGLLILLWLALSGWTNESRDTGTTAPNPQDIHLGGTTLKQPEAKHAPPAHKR